LPKKVLKKREFAIKKGVVALVVDSGNHARESMVELRI
jgi:hypothetical protein